MYSARNSARETALTTVTWTADNRTYRIQQSDITGAPQLFEQENKMSSLSRRACYKCGNVGHYAEVCSSSERLCYNCKQPGMWSTGATTPETQLIPDRPRVK